MCSAIKYFSHKVYRHRYDKDFFLVYIPTLEKLFKVPSKFEEKIPEQIFDETPITEILDDGFIPTDLIILPTTDCSLRCQYCYSRGGEEKCYLNPKIAFRAVDYIIENVLKCGNEQFTILFHGGGEPTLAWKTLTQTVDYAREKAKKHNLKVLFSLATNGTMTEYKRKYIIENFYNVTISIDGYRDIQNKQRSGSFDIVMQNAKEFYKSRDIINVGFRATLLCEHIEDLPKIVQFFGKEFSECNLTVEPLDVMGRCLSTGCTDMNFSSLPKFYLEAKRLAKEMKINFSYSAVKGYRENKYFCGVGGKNFVLTPEGSVSSCSRVCSLKDRAVETFFIGKFDVKTDSFKFFEEQIEKNKKFSVDNMKECSECIANAFCRGDCRMIRYNHNGGDVLGGVSSKCKQIREIVIEELFRQL